MATLTDCRLEMATEDLLSSSSKSSLRSDSGVGGSSDRDHPDYVKTSFYAAKNTILEELRSTNASTVTTHMLHVYGLSNQRFRIKLARIARIQNQHSKCTRKTNIITGTHPD